MSIYIAGLNREISHSQAIEGFAVFATLISTGAFIVKTAPNNRNAEKVAGPVQNVPILGKIIVVVHGLLALMPVLALTSTTALNSFHVPPWLERFRFPSELDLAIGHEGKIAIRIAASVALVGVYKMHASVLHYLGTQLSPIGVRQKPRIVSNGPFAYVRHPMYSIALLFHLGMAAAFWSYLPLITFSGSVVAFSIKIPIEEKLIIQKKLVGRDYIEYKKRVRSALIPYIF